LDLLWGQTSYPIGRALLDDARRWLVLRGGVGSLAVERPVRLLQGIEDEKVADIRRITIAMRRHLLPFITTSRTKVVK
jgi:hypothetical protein